MVSLRRSFQFCLGLGALVSVVGCGGGSLRDRWDDLKHGGGGTGETVSTDADGASTFGSESKGNVTRVLDEKGRWRATFTKGAVTVLLAGPTRTFTEETARDSVTHAHWVRTLPSPFQGKIDSKWLDAALRANAAKTPDVLAIALQYIEGAPAVYSGGLQIAGDASYGPIDPVTGEREAGSDVGDYLQSLRETGTLSQDAIDPERKRSLDCSGFVRMVFGYRNNFVGAGYKAALPLVKLKGTKTARSEENAEGAAGAAGERVAEDVTPTLPRTAEDLFYSGPGVVLVTDRGTVPNGAARAGLQPGDLVFFRADDAREARLDHMGIYLGSDDAGHARFVSSRKSADGPTFGDVRGASVLDGDGLYALAFRSARRF